MDTSVDAGPAQWLRTARAERRISQRELAALAGVPRSTIDRIEAGTARPRLETVVALLGATGYFLTVHDRHGRPLPVRRPPEYRDGGGRRFPAHLEAAPTPAYESVGASWWGWHRIAWPYADDWVPKNTYWRRNPPPEVVRVEHGHREHGRVWDDAT